MKRVSLVVLVLYLLTGVASAQTDDLDPGYWGRTPLPQRGMATYYAQGLMEYVWNYRKERGQVPDCPECVGAVALLRAGDIGRKIWITPPSAPDQVFGPFLVIDCAHTGDIPMLLSREWVVDLSYEVGQMWNMTGPVMDFVVWADPAEDAAPAAQPPPVYIPPQEVVISAPTPVGEANPTPAQQELLPTDPTPPVSTAAPLPTVPPGVPPLISTPTPAGWAASPLEETAAPVVTPEPPATATLAFSPTPEDVAVGRAGRQLLQAPADATPVLRAPTPDGTPRPTSQPILPPSGSRAPVPLPPDEEPSHLEQLWRTLMRLLRH